MKPEQIAKVLGDELSASGFTGYRSAWYWKHPEIVWVVSIRRPFEQMRLSIDVAVAVLEPGDGVEWPTSNSCQMQTSFEWLSKEVPINAVGGHEYERGAYYGIVLDGDDRVMTDEERLTALAGISVELGCIASHVNSLAKLKVFLDRPDVRKPLLKKEFRKLLEDGI